jgi:hypothetical protein
MHLVRFGECNSVYLLTGWAPYFDGGMLVEMKYSVACVLFIKDPIQLLSSNLLHCHELPWCTPLKLLASDIDN